MIPMLRLQFIIFSLIGIGFFAFLCILAFDNLAASMYEAQSMLTVISLAIVRARLKQP